MKSSAGQKWSIYIDIEGFGNLWEEGDDALWALRHLMEGIFRIGTKVYPSDPKRLFAHQIGDGFVIVSDFHEAQLDRPILIATVLMRYVLLSSGLFCRAAISEGGFSDIAGCYSDEVMDARGHHGEGSDTISMGAGLMTYFPVMGSALINAVVTDKKAPKGPVLSIEHEKVSRTSAAIHPFISSRASENAESSIDGINWLSLTHPDLEPIWKAVNNEPYTPVRGRELLNKYLANPSFSLPEEWKATAADLCKSVR